MTIAVLCPYFHDSLVEELARSVVACGADLHLWALDGLGPSLARYTRGQARLGKYQAVNRLLPYAASADLVMVIDDDVRLPPGFLWQFTTIVDALGAAMAQPALTPDSYFSHEITLQRPGRWARRTNFVETGPVTCMSRSLLERIAPFPEDNPMGWGLESLWAKVCEENDWPMAIVDACPVEHAFRPIGAQYSLDVAASQMARYLEAAGLSWCQDGFRTREEYPQVYATREEYLAAFPAPVQALEHGDATDIADDLPLLWAVASLVRPELIVELGTRFGVSTRALVSAAGQWGGRVVTADPADARPWLGDLPCQFVHAGGEELFAATDFPTKFLFIDTDPHDYRQTRRWLDTWVSRRLLDGGVAVFHDVLQSRPGLGVARAVRDWLREHPRGWRWQEFAGTSGLGLLWRLGNRPDFEAALAAAGRQFQPSQTR